MDFNKGNLSYIKGVAIMFVLISILTAVIILAIAGWEDLKTREIPDYVSYFFIAAAISIRLLWFLLEKDVSIIMWMPVSLLALGGFSYLMYVGGQWGGGDVKILLGTALLLSSFPGETIPFFANFIINSLIVGAIYGTLGIGVIYFIHRKKIKTKTHEKAVLPVVLIASACMLYFLPFVLAFLSIFSIIAFVSLLYYKRIEEVGFHQKVAVEKLTEGDWLKNDIMLDRKVFLKKRKIGLTLGDIRKLKASGKIKRVWIKVGIPYSPVFLITAIVTWIFGNLLLRIILM